MFVKNINGLLHQITKTGVKYDTRFYLSEADSLEEALSFLQSMLMMASDLRRQSLLIV
jgi:hypothetical protein